MTADLIGPSLDRLEARMLHDIAGHPAYVILDRSGRRLLGYAWQNLFALDGGRCALAPRDGRLPLPKGCRATPEYSDVF